MSKVWVSPLIGLFVLTSNAFAHGPSGHGSATASAIQSASDEQYAWGKMGRSNEVKREIVISMTDNMRFTPDRINIRLGETVRFLVRNDGKVLHEFVLGTPDELLKHAELMLKFPNMAHDEPYMAHVDPGQQGDVLWQFNRPGEFDFACLLPGHFQAGMVGKILVQ